MMKRRTDAFTGLFLSAVGLVMLVWVIPAQIPNSSDPTAIPPSFMANLTIGLIVALSLVLIAKALLQGKPESGPVITRSSLKWFAFVLVSLVGSGFLIHYLGFMWGGALLIAGYILFMGERRPTIVLAVAGGTAGFCYCVLKYVLKVI